MFFVIFFFQLLLAGSQAGSIRLTVNKMKKAAWDRLVLFSLDSTFHSKHCWFHFCLPELVWYIAFLVCYYQARELGFFLVFFFCMMVSWKCLFFLCSALITFLAGVCNFVCWKHGSTFVWHQNVCDICLLDTSAMEIFYQAHWS